MGRDGRPSGRTTPAADPQAWGAIAFAPEADPLPFELLDELEGKEVDVVVVNAGVRPTFDDEKSVTLTCRVLVDGEPRMVPGSSGPTALDLPYYFRLPVRADGRPFVPLRSKFYAPWCRANAGRQPSRRDRMPLSIFAHRVFRGRVRVVKTGSKQQKMELANELWRPIIEDIAP